MRKAGLCLLALVVPLSCDQSGTVVAPAWPVAPVHLTVDEMGITHVVAQSDGDALYGAGYAMARDRLTQMELFRRQAQGRSSELLGASSVSADVGARVVNFAVLGQQDEALARSRHPGDAMLVDAWVAGVNARIAELSAAKAPPCGLDAVPAPWVTADAFAIGKLLAFGLSNTIDAEILATALRRIVPDFVSKMPLLLPAFDVYTLGVKPAQGAVHAASPGPATNQGPPPDFAWPLFSAGHSNNWAVDAAHSANGRPLLAGDPHQPLSAPSRFWPVHLRSVDGGGTLDVIGFSFVGTPIVELGHNARIAWTATTNFADVMDLWDITTDADRTVVHLADGDHPIVTRVETIGVRGHDGVVQPSTYTIEEVPGYGVLLPDAMLPIPRSFLGNGDGILFRWTGSQPTAEISAYMGIDRAGDVDAFDAAADLLDVGAVNFVAADARHIDYHVHALIPDRGTPNGRAMPWHVVPGTDASLLWSGAWLGPERLPHWRDPARGFLVTGNNDPWGFTADGDVENDPFYYGAFYANGSRPWHVQQALEGLLAQRKATRADLEALQNDDHSVFSDSVLGHLASAMAAVGTDPKLAPYAGRTDLAALASLLAAWDGAMDRNRPEPVVFNALLWYATQRVFRTRMTPTLFDAVVSKSPPYLLGALHNVLEGRFPGATALLPDGDASELLLGALDDASRWLVTRFGSLDPSRFKWSDVNLAVFKSPLGGSLQPPPVAVDGANDTVKVCESSFFGSGGIPNQTTSASEISLYRMVVGFGADGTPQATLDFAEGAQECPGDPHRIDQQPAWVEGAHAPLAFTPADLAAHAVSTSVLGAAR